MRLLMEPSSVAILGYVFLFIYSRDFLLTRDSRFEHDDLAEPAILLGRRTGR